MRVLFGADFFGFSAKISDFCDADDERFAPFFSARETEFDRKISDRRTLREKRVARYLLKLLALSTSRAFAADAAFAAFQTARRSASSGRFSVPSEEFSPFSRTARDLAERFRAFSIVSRDALGRGAPPTCVADDPSFSDAEIFGANAATFSISHSGGFAFVVRSERFSVGCDLTPNGSVSPGTTRLFFTESERRLLRAQTPSRPFFADEIWALKEAAYKATRGAFPFKPTEFVVRPSSETPPLDGAPELEIAFRDQKLTIVRTETLDSIAHVVVGAARTRRSAA